MNRWREATIEDIFSALDAICRIRRCVVACPDMRCSDLLFILDKWATLDKACDYRHLILEFYPELLFTLVLSIGADVRAEVAINQRLIALAQITVHCGLPELCVLQD